MYHVYILRSIRNQSSYTGVTSNLKSRFTAHNSGKVKSTKHNRPWALVYSEDFPTLGEAKKREWFFKCVPQGGKLKKKILETAAIPAA